MKKAVSLMMAAAMTMGLAACGSTASTDTAASAADTASSTEAAASTADSTAAADGKVYNIGICQLVQHEALDAATQGFKDALVEKLGEGSVKFDEQNASGDSANCTTIVNGFVSNGVDLILANATAPLQAAAQATADIPVLGTSITDYATALDISDWTGTVGNNISGTSDLAPLDQQADMIVEWMPDAKKVGLLYCSAEANSQYQVDEVQKYLACTNHILYANMMVMNQDAWNDLDPLYQEALQQAVTEALADLAPDLAEIDQKNKDTLVEKGMTLIEYEDSFYEEVLAVPGVQELYKSIDESCGGLGTVLQEALKNA